MLIYVSHTGLKASFAIHINVSGLLTVGMLSSVTVAVKQNVSYLFLHENQYNILYAKRMGTRL